MIRTGVIALGTILMSLGDRPSSTLRLDYRDSHDGRVLAQVTARLEGRDLTIVLRPHGEGVEQPLGFEGFRGENFWTAWEIGDSSRVLRGGPRRPEHRSGPWVVLGSGNGFVNPKTTQCRPDRRSMVMEPTNVVRSSGVH